MRVKRGKYINHNLIFRNASIDLRMKLSMFGLGKVSINNIVYRVTWNLP